MAGTLGYLLSVCAVMFLGAYGAGSLPLVVDIGEARLRQVRKIAETAHDHPTA
jgi:hypothetical protein